MKRLALVLISVALALVACRQQSGSALAPSMAGHAFTPRTSEIEVGDTITWTNDTEEAHTVTAVESSLPEGAEYFSSGGAASEEEAKDSIGQELIEPGETFEWTFEEPGTYRYYCLPHMLDGMEGTVEVAG